LVLCIWTEETEKQSTLHTWRRVTLAHLEFIFLLLVREGIVEYLINHSLNYAVPIPIQIVHDIVNLQRLIFLIFILFSPLSCFLEIEYLMFSSLLSTNRIWILEEKHILTLILTASRRRWSGSIARATAIWTSVQGKNL
jgi:hypothetical protein